MNYYNLPRYYTTSFSVIISFAGSISWTFLGARSSWALRWPSHSSMPSRSSWPSSISSEILRAFVVFFLGRLGVKSSQGPKVVEKVDEGLDLWWIYIYIRYIHYINICIYIYIHMYTYIVPWWTRVCLCPISGVALGELHILSSRSWPWCGAVKLGPGRKASKDQGQFPLPSGNFMAL